MKLRKLHADNFGVLCGYDQSFRDGMNVILAENGWGKTTLASFIKAMLYGLSSGERRRFEPWQGGSFGGTLDIEQQGKTYHISRTFGHSPEDDTLHVTDALTSAPADLGACPGETLCGLDADGFERTIFLGHDALRLTGSTDDRLSAIVGSAGNTDGCDAAEERLRREMTRCETELLPALSDGIAAQEAVLRQLQEELTAQAQSRETLLQCRQSLDSLTAQLTEQQTQLDAYQAAMQQHQARLAVISGMEEELASLRNDQTALLQQVGGTLPAQEALDHLQRYQQTAAALALEQERLRKDAMQLTQELSALEQRYGGKRPDAALPDKLQALENERQSLLTEQERLTNDESDAPAGYRTVRDVSEPDFPERLEAAVAAEEQLRALEQQIAGTDAALREERALWEESRATLQKHMAAAEPLRAEVEAHAADTPEVIEPLLTRLEALTAQNAEYTQQIADLDKACIEAEKLWGNRQERFALMQEEVRRMQEELDQHKGYDSDEVRKAIDTISEMMKRRTRLSEDERTYKDSLRLEDIRWTEMHKHYENLKADADRLSREAADSACFDPDAVAPAAALLEEAQKDEPDLAFQTAEAERFALTAEEISLLETAPDELPDEASCTAVLQQNRKLGKLRSDLEELHEKQESSAGQLASLRSSAEQAAAIPDLPESADAGAPIGLILLIAGIVLTLAGIVLCLAVMPALAALAAVGILCIIIGIVLHIGRQKKLAAFAAKQEEHQKLVTRQTELNERIERAQADSEALTEKEQTLTQEIAACTEAVGTWCSQWLPGGDPETLPEAVERFTRMRTLREQQENCRAAEAEAAALRGRIDERLEKVYAQFPDLREKAPSEALTSLRASETEHRLLCKQRDIAADNLKTWLKNNGYDTKTTALDDGRSPKAAHLEEQLAAIQVAWGALAADREALDQKYPAIRGMDGEAALLFLTRQSEAYKLAAAKKHTAERTLLAFYAETKLNAEQLEQDASPEIPVLREKQTLLREELRAVDAEQRKLCAAYPEALNVPPEEAAAALQERLSRFRLLRSKLQAAEQEEARFLSGCRFTREELLGDGSAHMQMLYQTLTEAETKQEQLTADCTAVLEKIGIPAEPLYEGLHAAGQILLDYQTYARALEERRIHSKALGEQADALRGQQMQLLAEAGITQKDVQADELIRQIRSDAAAADVLQGQLSRNAEETARNAASAEAAEKAADTCMQGYTGTETDRAARIARFLGLVQEVNRLTAVADALQKQRDAAFKVLEEEAIPGVDGDALQAAVTKLTQEREQVLAAVSREEEAIRQKEQQLAAYPEAEAKHRQLTAEKAAAEERLTLLSRTAEHLSQAKAEQNSRCLAALHRQLGSYLERLPEKLRTAVTDDAAFSTQHPAVCYSSGEQTMLDLCMRAALAETLFADKEPFLLLDDPFTGLDEKQLAIALGMLRDLAAEQQMLYFACHPSRTEGLS